MNQPDNNKNIMKLSINIRTENAAFEDNAGQECARILRELADSLDGFASLDEFDAKLMDLNGNTVGSALVIGK